MLTVATWNVNSIKQRESVCAAWLKQAAPSVLCLQELKCQTEGFPRGAFEDLGYNCAVIGQKSFNGVAILSKFPIDEIVEGLPGDASDEQARYIEAAISLPAGKAIRVASIYAPNGNPAPSPKLDYKLAWLARLKAHAQTLLSYEEPLALAGDYNIIPRAGDVYNAAAWVEDALYRLEFAAGVPAHREFGADRRGAGVRRARRAIHLLGLSGRRLAEEPGAEDRPHPAVAAGSRHARIRRDRPPPARVGQTLGPHPRFGHAGDVARKIVMAELHPRLSGSFYSPGSSLTLPCHPGSRGLPHHPGNANGVIRDRTKRSLRSQRSRLALRLAGMTRPALFAVPERRIIRGLPQYFGSRF